ncbi:MAG: DUF58 domain-containing protein [Bdellovibrionales bacterium]|nr:DUF58 domain-containing protein [Bdellovibrionales bacterium]
MNESILKKVKRIEISSRRMMDDIMAGGYKSKFRGQGVQFSEHRQYTPGDDIRHLDWKVSARSREPLIKQYEEERELNVFIIADYSASTDFGSRKNAKKDLISELGAMIAYAASNSGDKVGVLFVTDRVRKTIELKKGKNHVLRIIRDLAAFQSEPGGTGLRKAFEETRRLLKHSGIVFILSDFKADGYENALRQLSRKHDVVAIKISDPAEVSLPDVGNLTLLDPESRIDFDFRPDSDRLKKLLQDSLNQFETKTKQTFNLAGVETLNVETTEDHAEKLLFFLKRRKTSR